MNIYIFQKFFDNNHTVAWNLSDAVNGVTPFFYKNKSLDFGKKFKEQTKNKATLSVPQNIRTKCLGQPFLK